MDIDDVQRRSAMERSSANRPDGMRAGSGCVVTWRKCDKIEYQRLGWAEKMVMRDLGRMYRRFLTDGVVITVNRKPITPIDPLIMTELIEGDRARPAF